MIRNILGYAYLKDITFGLEMLEQEIKNDEIAGIDELGSSTEKSFHLGMKKALMMIKIQKKDLEEKI